MPQVLLAGSLQTRVGLVEIPRAPSVAASAVAIGWLVLVVVCSVLAWAASTGMVRAASGSRRDSVRKVGTRLVELVGRVQGGTSVRLAITDSPVASLGLEVPHSRVAMRLVVEVSIVASVSVAVDE